MDDQRTDREGGSVSREFKIFLAVLFGLGLWMTIVDSLYMVPFAAPPLLIILIVAEVFVIRKILRRK
jgi:hypothetical protein